MGKVYTPWETWAIVRPDQDPCLRVRDHIISAASEPYQAPTSTQKTASRELCHTHFPHEWPL